MSERSSTQVLVLILAEMTILRIGTIPIGTTLHVHRREFMAAGGPVKTAFRISVGAHRSMLMAVH